MGVTDKNLFAYCDNNPVVRIDISGYGWKELWGWVVDKYERITSIHAQEQMVNNQILSEQIEMVSDAADAIAGAYERITSIHAQEQMVNNQILSEQIEMVSDAADTIWNAYMRGYNLQQEAQLQNSQALVDGAKYFAQHPKEAEGVMRSMVGTSVAATELISAAIAGGPIGTLGAATAVALWDLCWCLYDVISDFE